MEIQVGAEVHDQQSILVPGVRKIPDHERLFAEHGAVEVDRVEDRAILSAQPEQIRVQAVDGRVCPALGQVQLAAAKRLGIARRGGGAVEVFAPQRVEVVAAVFGRAQQLRVLRLGPDGEPARDGRAFPAGARRLEGAWSSWAGRDAPELTALTCAWLSCDGRRGSTLAAGRPCTIGAAPIVRVGPITAVGPGGRGGLTRCAATSRRRPSPGDSAGGERRRRPGCCRTAVSPHSTRAWSAENAPPRCRAARPP